jgi:beta-glucuronidase
MMGRTGRVKKVLGCGLVLFGLGAGAAESIAPACMANVYGRETVSLNGTWRTIIDPYNNGNLTARLEERPPEQPWNFWFEGVDQGPEHRREHDFFTGDVLNVPGDWNTQQERLFFYEGIVWYRRHFDYELPAGRRLFVYFGAANYEARVWLNGTSLGKHEGGFTPFQFEITDLVRSTNNFLTVSVDNERRADRVPGLKTDWWNYGGLTRDVLLVEVPETFIADYSVQLEPGSLEKISGWVQLDGPDLEQDITIEIAGQEISTAVHADEAGRAEFVLEYPWELWSPENPKRYDVQIRCATDAVNEQIGFRSVAVRGTDILLNGDPVFLRGICIHEEAPLREGRAYSKDDYRQLLEWAKEMNCNYVRLSHYPHHEYMTRLADEMGLLVWSEVPVYWAIDWNSPQAARAARQQLAENIQRDKNRCSVIIWSIGNETGQSDAAVTFRTGLARLVRSLDSTRLVSAALEAHEEAPDPAGGPPVVVLDDPFGAEVDVLACNEYRGWYAGTVEDIPNCRWDIRFNKPLIISEFGAGARQGFHGPKEWIWTEEHMQWVYEQQLRMFSQIDQLCGISPWILRDFRSPLRALKGVQDYYNRKGLISDRGLKKSAFYLMQKFYGQMLQDGANTLKPGPRINPK